MDIGVGLKTSQYWNRHCNRPSERRYKRKGASRLKAAWASGRHGLFEAPIIVSHMIGRERVLVIECNAE